MRTISLAVALLTLFASGCTGDDDDDDGGSGVLTTGVYLVTSSVTNNDGCAAGPSVAVNDTVNVTVTGNSISMGVAVSGDIDGSTIDAPDGSPNTSQTNSGADNCSETTSDNFSGTITADDEFTLRESYDNDVSNPQNWSGCPYTACTSTFTYKLAK